MRSKQENNIQEKLCKKFVEGGEGSGKYKHNR